MRWINYHHLIYFKEIATKGSISKASQALRVGQPALSAQLKQLEESLGVSLFERKNRSLILTESGKLVLEYAKKISSLGQELVKVVDHGTLNFRSRLSVGALDSIPKHLICDIVDFAHKETDCFLSIVEDDINALLRQLRSHEIDIIIADHKVAENDHRKIVSKKIVTRPIMAYAAPKFKSLKDNFPYSLNEVPCIVPTDHSKIREDINHFFEEKETNPLYIAETQDTSLQKILAAKGDGVIFLPKFSTKDLVQHNQLVEIGSLEDVYAEYYLIHGDKVFENPALDLVVKQDFDKMKL